MVLKCDCKHDFQDNHYGHGSRYCNLTRKGSKLSGIAVYRCTVCSKEHSVYAKVKEEKIEVKLQ